MLGLLSERDLVIATGANHPKQVFEYQSVNRVRFRSRFVFASFVFRVGGVSTKGNDVTNMLGCPHQEDLARVPFYTLLFMFVLTSLGFSV